VLGNAYEYLIKKFADLSNEKAGEFYTPRSVVKMLVNFLDPQEGETVYDPACGTGGMLIEVVHHVPVAPTRGRQHDARAVRHDHACATFRSMTGAMLRRKCPRCSSPRTVPIVYGLPDAALGEAAEAGLVELGGCVVSPGRPNSACSECGHRWRSLRPDLGAWRRVRRSA